MAKGKSKSPRIRSGRRPPPERHAFWTNRSFVAVALAAVVAGGLTWALAAQGSDDPGAGDFVIGEFAAQGRDLVTAAPNRDSAPQFSVRTASYGDGGTFDLQQSRGDIVILYFMAAWCVTCIPETEALDVLHDRYASLGVRILIVDVDTTEDEGDLSEFRDKTGQGNHLWAMDTGNVIAQTFGVRFLDTTIIIDRQGNVAFSDARPTEYETLAAVVEALL